MCAAALLGAALAWNNLRSRAAQQPPPVPLAGTRLDRAVPDLTLVDQHGHTVSTAAWRGKVVVISPVLTLCTEVCPITTGAFDQIERVLRQDGLAGRVVLAEVSVDPWRDSPARLRGYARLTGTDVPLYTGSLRQIAAFWKFFGVYYKKVPEGRPAQVDWMTHRKLTFDVAHTDGLMFVDPSGHWRIAMLGMPNVNDRLTARLRRLLSASGLHNLAHPMTPWTIPQTLRIIGSLLGRSVPG